MSHHHNADFNAKQQQTNSPKELAYNMIIATWTADQTDTILVAITANHLSNDDTQSLTSNSVFIS
eukprot:936978-Ditylum_brightwellii.AAC.2